MAEDDELRKQAIDRLNEKRGFYIHLTVYVVVNLALVGIWAMTRGPFWPAFVMIFWGIGIVMHGVGVFTKGPSEDRIQREMDRMRGPGPHPA